MNLLLVYQNSQSNPKKFYDYLAKIKAAGEKFEVLEKSLPKKGTYGQVAFEALSPVAPLRRLAPVEDKVKKKDYSGVAGVLALAGILLPEDMRDVKSSVAQLNSVLLCEKTKEKIKCNYPKFYDKFVKYEKRYDHREYQVPFSFIRGSFLEPIVNKMGRFGCFVHRHDKTLFQTKAGQWLAEKLGVRLSGSKMFTGRLVKRIVNDKDGESRLSLKKIYAYKFEGGNSVSRFFCRVLQRITVYGLGAMVLISLPFVLKSKNRDEEAQKLAVGTLTTTASIGFFGTLLAKLGPAGSLIGMGYGSVIATRVNRNI